jgi:hypothetical protein
MRALRQLGIGGTATGALGTSLSSAELGDETSFTGWDFTDVWQLDDALSPYPSLGFE